MSTAVEERVENGAKWLDEHRPSWFKIVDPDTLNIADPNRCIWGQLTGHYSNRPDELTNGYSFGFNAFGSAWRTMTFSDIEVDYVQLNAAWRKAIEDRRTGDPSLN